MNEAEYLRERAQSCHRIARSSILALDANRLEAQAAEFERRAAALDARLSLRK